MKKLLFASILLLFTLQACYDDYKTDYLYSTSYFAFQHPVRTLLQEPGEELKFELGVSLGGKYTNENNEVIDYIIAPELLDSIMSIDSTVSFKLLPADYYTVSNDAQMIISSGNFVGDVTFTLDSEKFLNDSLSHTSTYVMPLEITGSTTDSILTHKDYTIAVIKYINQYEGYYWLKGKDLQLDLYGNPVDTFAYAEEDLVLNRSILMSTEGKDVVKVNYAGRNLTDSDSDYSMRITIRDDGKAVLSPQDNSIITAVTGAGVYSIGDRGLVLDYRYVDAFGATHQVNDTLIYRNTEMKFTTWADNPAAPLE